jgi:hypothetical protein
LKASSAISLTVCSLWRQTPVRRSTMVDESRWFRNTADLVIGIIDIAIQRNDGAGLEALRRRAQRTLKPPEAPRSSAEAEQAAIELERDYLIAAPIQLLVESVRDGVVAALRADPAAASAGLTEDPWLLVDPDVLRARERAAEVESIRAQGAAIASCRRYEQTRRTSHLGRAVRELEAAARAQLDPLCPPLAKAACAEQADRLERAFRLHLPDSAFRYLMEYVRGVIAEELMKAGPGTTGTEGEPQQLLTRDAWTTPRLEEPSIGVWFVDWLQRDYDEMVERRRVIKEAQHRRKGGGEDVDRRAEATRDEPEPPERDQGPDHGLPTGRQLSNGGTGAETVPPTQLPELNEQDDHVMWPAHADDYARWIEEKAKANVEDNEEFLQEGLLLAANEAQRMRAKAAELEVSKRYAARLAKKASPDRIQRRD